jgi:hypothetical protein
VAEKATGMPTRRRLGLRGGLTAVEVAAEAIGDALEQRRVDSTVSHGQY